LLGGWRADFGIGEGLPAQSRLAELRGSLADDFLEGAIEGPEGRVPEPVRDLGHTQLPLAGIGQQLPSLTHPEMIQERVEVAESELGVDELTHLVLRRPETAGQARDRQSFFPEDRVRLDEMKEPLREAGIRRRPVESRFW